MGNKAVKMSRLDVSPALFDTDSSSISGEEFRNTHSEMLISNISPEYLSNPSPSLGIINNAGRSESLSFKLEAISSEEITKK